MLYGGVRSRVSSYVFVLDEFHRQNRSSAWLQSVPVLAPAPARPRTACALGVPAGQAVWRSETRLQAIWALNTVRVCCCIAGPYFTLLCSTVQPTVAHIWRKGLHILLSGFVSLPWAVAALNGDWQFLQPQLIINLPFAVTGLKYVHFSFNRPILCSFFQSVCFPYLFITGECGRHLVVTMCMPSHPSREW